MFSEINSASFVKPSVTSIFLVNYIIKHILHQSLFGQVSISSLFQLGHLGLLLSVAFSDHQKGLQ